MPTPLGITRMQAFACRGVHVQGLSSRELARLAGARTPDAIRMRRLRARRKLTRSPDPAVRRLADALNLASRRRTRPAWSLLPGEA